MRSSRRQQLPASPTRQVLAVAVTAMLGAGAVGCATASADEHDGSAETTSTQAVTDFSDFPDVTLDGINERTQVTVMDLETGIIIGTDNQHDGRSGLSQNKLYIADWVVKNGSDSDAEAAVNMLKDSNDLTAQSLYWKYGTETINDTAEEYDLEDTYGIDRWGSAPTSPYDLVKFISAKIEEDPNDPVLRALRNATPVAADGYSQDFGTSEIDGVKGTKWGWTDDHSSGHSSTSFGDGFVISVHTYGSKSQHDEDVEKVVADSKTTGNLSLNCAVAVKDSDDSSSDSSSSTSTSASSTTTSSTSTSTSTTTSATSSSSTSSSATSTTTSATSKSAAASESASATASETPSSTESSSNGDSSGDTHIVVTSVPLPSFPALHRC